MDTKTRVETFLAPHIVTLLHNAGQIAATQKMRLLLVGGAVRDLFLAQSNKDMDLVVGPLTTNGTTIDPETDAMPDFAYQFGRALIDQLGGKMIKRSQFGTIKIVIDQETLEIATARRETYPVPGALPVIQPGTVEQDLWRRDFTVNAMSIELNPGNFGELLDPLGGIEDLQKKLLRPIHSKTFQDDPTRLLRAVRYENRLKFKMTRTCVRWIQRDAKYINEISGERIWNELIKIGEEAGFNRTMLRAQKLGILPGIATYLNWSDSLGRQLSTKESLCYQDNLLLYLVALANDLSQDQMNRLKADFRVPKKWRLVLDANQWITFQTPTLKKPVLTSRELYNCLTGIAPNILRARLVITNNRTVVRNIKRFLKELLYIRPRLSPTQIVGLGVSEGPQIAEVLNILKNTRLDNMQLSLEEEESLVQAYLESQ